MRSRLLREVPDQRACDRCYLLKERCERAQSTDKCSRCIRLRQRCSTVRPQRPKGRRPHHQILQDDEILPTRSDSHLRSLDELCKLHAPALDLPSAEADQRLFGLIPGQSDCLDITEATSSVRDAGQSSHLGEVLPSRLRYKDVYLAYRDLQDTIHFNLVDRPNRDSDLRRASSALNALRTLDVKTRRDASMCLALGSTLVLFVYVNVNIGVSDICNYCLSTARSFIDAEDQDATSWSRALLIVLLETMDSLVHRRKPTIRIMKSHANRVDRLLGISWPLLPSYYDLCGLSQSLAEATNEDIIRKLHWQLDGVQACIDAWSPTIPDGFLDGYPPSRVVLLLAQAKVYRLGALLIAHRLRCCFGHEDGKADVLSREILMELALARQMAKTPVRFVTMPFMIAAVEVRDPSSRMKVLSSVDDHVDPFSPPIRTAMRSFLRRIWSERDSQCGGRWLDFMHKPCVILESLMDSP